MRYFELSKEEEKLLKDFENEVFVRVSDAKEKKALYQKYAEDTLKKSKNINLRLSLKDFQRLKSKAVEEGIPYQTLAASVLHRFAAA